MPSATERSVIDQLKGLLIVAERLVDDHHVRSMIVYDTSDVPYVQVVGDGYTQVVYAHGGYDVWKVPGPTGPVRLSQTDLSAEGAVQSLLKTRPRKEG